LSVLSKILTNKPTPVSPTGPQWREIPVYWAFCVSLKNLIKIPLNKKALREEHPSKFPIPLWYYVIHVAVSFDLH
jgi:hypothetical protein